MARRGFNADDLLLIFPDEAKFIMAAYDRACILQCHWKLSFLFCMRYAFNELLSKIPLPSEPSELFRVFRNIMRACPGEAELLPPPSRRFLISVPLETD